MGLFLLNRLGNPKSGSESGLTILKYQKIVLFYAHTPLNLNSSLGKSLFQMDNRTYCFFSESQNDPTKQCHGFESKSQPTCLYAELKL